MFLPFRQPRLLLLALLWVGLFTTAPGSVLAGGIAVLYPQVEEPYRSVFQTILKGIESQPGLTVKPLAVAEAVDAEKLKEWLRTEQVDLVVALGKQGFLAARSLGGSVPVLLGALPSAAEELPGISLSPDPEVLFRSLRELAPKVERVHVIYSKSNDWLVRLAREAARTRNLKLVAYRAEDLREAVRLYRDLLKQVQNGKESVWLPLDNITANDEVVLPMLLQAAWDKGLVVFSSKPSHAQRGVLFSMFPDHFALGQRLGELALRIQGTNERPPTRPLADVQLAVNLRTAAHLGLRFTPGQQAKFDLVFPSR